jgi:hypothetical protein
MHVVSPREKQVRMMLLTHPVHVASLMSLLMRTFTNALRLIRSVINGLTVSSSRMASTHLLVTVPGISAPPCRERRRLNLGSFLSPSKMPLPLHSDLWVSRAFLVSGPAGPQTRCPSYSNFVPFVLRTVPPSAYA